jgi:hypothetical protein
VAQVYPDFDARPGLTALSRLRHRQWSGEGILVQLSIVMNTKRGHKKDRVDRADVHGFDGEE